MNDTLTHTTKGTIKTQQLDVMTIIQRQVTQVKKFMGLPPLHLNYLGIFLSFRRTFAEVITFGKAAVQELQPYLKLSVFEIGHLLSHNINALLWLHIGMHIVSICLYLSIRRALHTGSPDENNIGAATT